MDRKNFLKIAAGTAVGWSAWLAACRIEEEEAVGLDAVPGQRYLPNIGLQLYTIRRLAIRDLRGALAAAAETGYTEVEFAGYFDHTPEQVRAMVDELALDPVSTHVSLEELRNDLEAVASSAEIIGHRYVVLPYLLEEDRGGLDDYRRLADELNQIGQRLSQAGIRFGYHNHDFEFTRIDGVVPFDLLLEGTDPELVTFELDLYWATYAFADPAAYLNAHPGRFQLCHLKDMDRYRQMTDVGAGQIDFARILHFAKAGGLEHFFVEHDAPPDPAASIQASYAHLSDLRF